MMDFDQVFFEIISEKKELFFEGNIKKERIDAFKSKGWYDGQIISAFNFSVRKGDLRLSCVKMSFFDFLIEKELMPKKSYIIGLNAIIEVDDYVILINRGPDVFSFENHWDFPAGIFISDVDAKSRVLDRIEHELKISKSNFEIKEIFPVAFILDESLNLFYKVSTSLTKDQLSSLFSQNFIHDKPILVEKSKLREFIQTNPTVFPEVLKMLT